MKPTYFKKNILRLCYIDWEQASTHLGCNGVEEMLLFRPIIT